LGGDYADLGDRVPLHVAHDQFHCAEARPVSDRGCSAEPAKAAGKLIAAWRRHGSELGFGAGIAQGYATTGQIGFSERSGYTAIGTVFNLAARLCAEAKDGQILVSSRIAGAVEAVVKS
jgi:class 3 adenylate cyclase